VRTSVERAASALPRAANLVAPLDSRRQRVQVTQRQTLQREVLLELALNRRCMAAVGALADDRICFFFTTTQQR
jgi:hypothetical protein